MSVYTTGGVRTMKVIQIFCITIIAIITISWGGVCAQIMGVTKTSSLLPTTHREAGLLIEVTRLDALLTEDKVRELIKNTRWQDRVYADNKPRRRTRADFVKLDGAPIINPETNSASMIELSPGNHTYEAFVHIDKYTHQYYIQTGIERVTGSIHVQPHGVYIFDAEPYGLFVEAERARSGDGGMNPHVWVGPFHYDQTTGIATHPTDNKLSFKVK